MRDIIIQISDLLRIADAYIATTKIEDKRLSGRMFGDSKKLTTIREGNGITVERYNTAVCWLSDHWPEGAVWPEDIVRPKPQTDVAAE